VIDEKIINFRQNIALARRLAENEYADKEYYNKVAKRLERMLKFYEDLKSWKEYNGT